MDLIRAMFNANHYNVCGDLCLGTKRSCHLAASREDFKFGRHKLGRLAKYTTQVYGRPTLRTTTCTKLTSQIMLTNTNKVRACLLAYLFDARLQGRSPNDLQCNLGLSISEQRSEKTRLATGKQAESQSGHLPSSLSAFLFTRVALLFAVTWSLTVAATTGEQHLTLTTTRQMDINQTDSSATHYLDRRNFGNRLQLNASSPASETPPTPLPPSLIVEPEQLEAKHDYETASRLTGKLESRADFYGGPAKLIRLPSFSSAGSSILETWSGLLAPSRLRGSNLTFSSGSNLTEQEPDGPASVSSLHLVEFTPSGNIQQPNFASNSSLLQEQPSSGGSGGSLQDWLASSSSDIEQVISKQQLDGATDKQQQQSANSQRGATGHQDQAQAGERLAGHELQANWQREQAGEEQEKAQRHKEQEKEQKWHKDLGHNKHGWKNVYHREEFAQHQKYHDLFRDKDWDKQRGRTDESHETKQGQKYADQASGQSLDLDRHNSKYDFSRGTGWKRLEEDTDQSGDQQQQRQLATTTEPGQQADQHYEPSASYAEEVGVAAPATDSRDEEPDEREMEQIRDKLDKMSGPQDEDEPQTAKTAKLHSINEILRSQRGGQQSAGRDHQAIARNSAQQHLADGTAPMGASSASVPSPHSPGVDDEFDQDSYEHEPTEKPSGASSDKSRKNEIRLKLELNLGKSENQRRPSSRRNLNGPTTAFDVGRGHKKSADRLVNTGGWLPKGELADEVPLIKAEKDDHQAGLPHRSAQMVKTKEQPVIEMVKPDNFHHHHYHHHNQQQPVKEVQLNSSYSLHQGKTNKHHHHSKSTMNPQNKQLEHAIMADDFRVESSLADALGDQDPPSSHHQAMASISELPMSSGEPSLAKKGISKHSAKPKQEYMVLFGDSKGAASQQIRSRVRKRPVMEVAQHQSVMDPHVIFETSASSNVGHLDGPSVASMFPNAQESTESPANLEQMIMMPEAFMANQQKAAAFSLANLRLQTMGNKYISSPVGSGVSAGGQENRLANLLRLSPLIGSHLVASGSSLAANVVAPTGLQQAFGRLLRLPRLLVGSQAALTAASSEPSWPTSAEEAFTGGSATASLVQPEESQLQVVHWPHRPMSVSGNEPTPMLEGADFMGLRPQLNLQQGLGRPLEIGDLVGMSSGSFARYLPVYHPPADSISAYPMPMMPRPAVGPMDNGLKEFKRPEAKKKKSSPPLSTLSVAYEQKGAMGPLGAQWKKPVRFESNYTSSSSSSFLPNVFKWNSASLPQASMQVPSVDVHRGRHSGKKTRLSTVKHMQSSHVVPAQLRKALKSTDKREKARANQQKRLAFSEPAQTSFGPTKAPNFGAKVLASFKSKFQSAGGGQQQSSGRPTGFQIGLV